MRAVAGRTTMRIHHQTRHCVHLIRRLQDAGEEELAAAVARRCTDSVTEVAAHGTGLVRQIGEHCVRVLHDLAAPEELIELTMRRARWATDAIENAAHSAIQLIEEALHGE
jgi:hypothetical protein